MNGTGICVDLILNLWCLEMSVLQENVFLPVCVNIVQYSIYYGLKQRVLKLESGGLVGCETVPLKSWLHAHV